jgi:hypothetical protein
MAIALVLLELPAEEVPVGGTQLLLLGTKNSQKICSIVTNRGFSVW